MTTSSERMHAFSTFPVFTALSSRLGVCRWLRAALAGVCASMLMLGANSARAQAQAVTFDVQTIVPAGGLDTPYGLAVDAVGDVFIADSNNNRVVEVPTGCTSATCQVTVPVSGLYLPHSLAVDGAGDVFIADTYHSRIVEVPAGCTTAACQTTLGSGLKVPDGVAVDGAGDVFIADTGNHRVVELPAGCTSAACQTTVGSGLSAVEGVAVDGAGDVFIADYGNGRAVEVPAGCTSAACQITVVSGLMVPAGVAVDGAGNVFVSDAFTSRVVENPTGCTSAACQTTIGTGLDNPAGVAVDAAGDVFIADVSNNRVVEVRHSSVNFGSVRVGASETITFPYNVNSTTTFGTPKVLTQGAPNLDFTLGSGGTCTGTLSVGSSCTLNVTFAPRAPGAREGAVQLFDNSGNLLASTLVYGIGLGPAVAFGPGVQITVGSGLYNPQGVATDAAGDVFIADTSNHRVVELPAGCATAACEIMVGSGLTFPQAVAVDGAGDVFIVDSANRRVVEVPAGCTGAACQTTVGSGFDDPTGVAVDGAGDVFIADPGNNRVVEIPAGGGAQTTVGSGLAGPQAVAVDSAGDVFIADLANDRVVEIPAGGGAQTTVGGGFGFPAGVAVDGAGDVFITGIDGLVEVPAGGGAQVTVGSGFNGPIGVAVDGVGDVFIADTYNSRVVELQHSQPPLLNFAETQVGQTSSDSPQSVTLQNIGNQPLAAIAPGLVINGPNFVEVEGSGTPADCGIGFSAAPLAPGATCDLNISFEPQSVGPLSSAAVFTDNALNASPSASQTISLHGFGIGTQTIDFTLPANVTALTNVPLVATATSGLPVTLRSTTPTVCNVSGANAQFQTAGTCTILATQSGDAVYQPAPPVSQSTTVALAPQTINFAPLGTQKAGTTATLRAAAPSNGTITFASTTPSVCTVSGSIASFLTSGSCTLTASVPANNTYAAASTSQTVTVNLATQSITFAALASQTAGTTATLSATSLSNGTITFASNTPTVCTVSGTTASFLTSGSCTLTASVPANNTYAAATTSQTVTVNLATQTLTFAAIGPQTAGTAATLSATSPSNGTITFASITPGVCSVSGVKASFLTSGSCTLTASVPANNTYASATTSQTVAVTLAAQTITFTRFPASQLQGTSLPLSATATSGLAVSFTSLTPTVCTVSGSTATLLQAGTCTIQAAQTGSATYAAAASVSQSLTVMAAAAFTIRPTPSSETIYRGDIAAFLLELKALNGFNGKVTLSCSGGPSGSYCADFPMTVSFRNGIALALSGVYFPATTTPGTYILTFTGVSGPITENASATFTVEARR